MAEEKKAKKPARKAKATKETKPKEVETVEEVETEEVEETPKKVAKKEETRTLSNTDMIPVMNNTTGRYVYRARSGFGFEMNEYGDIVEVPYSELKTMRGEQRRNIEDAFIVILDEDAVNELGYNKLYENVLQKDEVERILKDPDLLADVIDKMPKNMKQTVGAIGVRKFRNREIDSLRVRDILEEKLGIEVEK